MGSQLVSEHGEADYADLVLCIDMPGDDYDSSCIYEMHDDDINWGEDPPVHYGTENISPVCGRATSMNRDLVPIGAPYQSYTGFIQREFVCPACLPYFYTVFGIPVWEYPGVGWTRRAVQAATLSGAHVVSYEMLPSIEEPGGGAKLALRANGKDGDQLTMDHLKGDSEDVLDTIAEQRA